MLCYLSFALSASVFGTFLFGSADVVYVYQGPATSAIPAVLWKILRRIPFVENVQDMWPESVIHSGMVGSSSVKCLLEKAITWGCRQIYRSAGRLVVISEGAKSLLVARGVPSEKIVVISNWIEETVFHPDARDERLAADLGFTDKFNLVYTGNVGQFQDLANAIEVAEQLLDVPRFQLVIVGSGTMLPELKEDAARRGLSNVRFLDRRPLQEMGRISNLADALLVSLEDLPNFSGTVPSKTQAALATGRPIIVAIRGDAATMIKRSGGGITCQPSNPSSLEAAIRQLMSMSSVELAEMGAQGRSFYLEHLSLETGGRTYEQVFTDLVGARSGR